MFPAKNRKLGFTLLELLVALAIAAVLVTALSSTAGRVIQVQHDTESRTSSLRDAQFAMHRMITAVRHSDRLLLPLADNPGTNWREHVREQSIPAAPPEGSSTFATAVLAVTLGPSTDLDNDGFADADNDKDGRIDEDLGSDNNNDGNQGIVGIDDDGDGFVDEPDATSVSADNDEDGTKTDDPINGIDDDGDGSIDEDVQRDNNLDTAPGIKDFDDDGDGSVDEGNNGDNDEDGSIGEDWYDSVVFFLSSATLMERRPNLNPADGTDYSELPIAENVTYFRVERLPDNNRRATLVDITLEITPPGSEATRMQTRIRTGDAR